jgi:hypothetical protein
MLSIFGYAVLIEEDKFVSIDLESPRTKRTPFGAMQNRTGEMYSGEGMRD